MHRRSPLPRRPRAALFLAAALGLGWGSPAAAQRTRKAPGPAIVIEGPLRKWHALTMTFTTAVDTDESGHAPGANPFLDFRLTVTFTHALTGRRHEVPGFFAADGDAADTSATAGATWQARFAPDQPGTWNWSVAFRRGPELALELAEAGATADPAIDGALGVLQVAPADPAAPGYLAEGRLEYVQSRYFRFAESGACYLKNGAGGPENLLAYFELDGTLGDPASLCLTPPDSLDHLHRFPTHAADFLGDEVDLRHLWGSPPRGHNLLGAIDYLASVGVNSSFFLTNGYRGDGNDVWPWVSPTDKRHYDVSKLAQWERVFAHMTARGLHLQFILEESENDQLSVFAGGLGYGLTPERRLYYRELVARFAHHPALTWIIGDESNYYDEVATMESLALALRALDPYDHPIAFHSKHPCVGAGCPQEFPTVLAQYAPYFDFPAFEASAFQTVPGAYNNSTLQLVSGQSSSRPWAHFGDEQSLNAIPTNLAENRRKALWGNLMAGGAGVSWYPGNSIAAQYPAGVELCDYYDVAIEDLRLLEEYFLHTAHALRIFQEQLPFPAMGAANELIDPRGPQDYVFRRPEDAQVGTTAVYAVYLGGGSETALSIGAGTHSVEWFNPRTGAGPSTAPALVGPGAVFLPPPAEDPGEDWLAIVRQE